VGSPFHVSALRGGCGGGRCPQAALAAEGIPAFLCEVEVGGDVEKEVVQHVVRAPLVTVMGTRTYGKETTASFSAYQELRFVVERKKPIFLVTICHDFEGTVRCST
jgi:hypothetical protein